MAAERENGELAGPKCQQLIEALDGRKCPAGSARAQPSIVGLALERPADPAQGARVIRIGTVDAVGN